MNRARLTKTDCRGRLSRSFGKALRNNGRMEPESAPKLSASQKFEEEARLWEETGELQWCGKNEYGFIKLRCWIDTKGAAVDGVSERLHRYHEAVEAKYARWGDKWCDDFLRNRDWCSVCGESFRLENLSLCTHCQVLFGYCHYPMEKAANGNPKCPRCEHGEIVG